MSLVPVSSSIKPVTNTAIKNSVYPQWHIDVTSRNDWLASLNILISGGSGFTPFTVGPPGSGPNGSNPTYITIQSAINAAVLAKTTAGPQFGLQQYVYIKPGTYTENLTFANGVHLIAFADGQTRAVTVNAASTGPSGGANHSIPSNTDGGDMDIFVWNICFASTVANAATATITHSGTSKVLWEGCEFLHANTTAPFFLQSGAGLDNFYNSNGVVTGTPFSPGVNVTGAGTVQGFKLQLNFRFDYGLNGSGTLNLVESRLFGYLLGTGTNTVNATDSSFNNAGLNNAGGTLTVGSLFLFKINITSTVQFNVSPTSFTMDTSEVLTAIIIQPSATSGTNVININSTNFYGAMTITCGTPILSRTISVTATLSSVTVKGAVTISTALLSSGNFTSKALNSSFCIDSGNFNISTQDVIGGTSGVTSASFSSCTIGSATTTNFSYLGSAVNSTCIGNNILSFTDCHLVSVINYTPIVGAVGIVNTLLLDSCKCGSASASVVNQINVIASASPGTLNISINNTSTYGTVRVLALAGGGSGASKLSMSGCTIKNGSLATSNTSLIITGGTVSALTIILDSINITNDLTASTGGAFGMQISGGSQQSMIMNNVSVFAASLAFNTRAVDWACIGNSTFHTKSCSFTANSNGALSEATALLLAITPSGANTLSVEIFDTTIKANSVQSTGTGISITEGAGNVGTSVNISNCPMNINSGTTGFGIVYIGSTTGALFPSFQVNNCSIVYSGNGGSAIRYDDAESTNGSIVSIANNTINMTGVGVTACLGFNYTNKTNTRSSVISCNGNTININVPALTGTPVTGISIINTNNPAGIVIVTTMNIANTNISLTSGSSLNGIIVTGNVSTTATSTNNLNISSSQSISSVPGLTAIAMVYTQINTLTVNNITINEFVSNNRATITGTNNASAVANVTFNYCNLDSIAGAASGLGTNVFNINHCNIKAFGYPQSTTCTVNLNQTNINFAQGAGTIVALTLPSQVVTFRAVGCTFSVGNEVPLSANTIASIINCLNASAGSEIVFSECNFKYVSAANAGVAFLTLGTTLISTVSLKACTIDIRATATALTATLILTGGGGSVKFEQTNIFCSCISSSVPLLTTTGTANADFNNSTVTLRTTTAAYTGAIITNSATGLNNWSNSSFYLDSVFATSGGILAISAASVNRISGCNFNALVASQSALGLLANITSSVSDFYNCTFIERATTGGLAGIAFRTTAPLFMSGCSFLLDTVTAAQTSDSLFSSSAIVNITNSNFRMGSGSALGTTAGAGLVNFTATGSTLGATIDMSAATNAAANAAMNITAGTLTYLGPGVISAGATQQISGSGAGNITTASAAATATRSGVATSTYAAVAGPAKGTATIVIYPVAI